MTEPFDPTDVLNRLEALEAMAGGDPDYQIGIDAIPLEALKNRLMNDWLPSGDTFIAPHSIGAASLDGTLVSDDATKGIVLKDAQAPPLYWRVTVNHIGPVLVLTDLGTTKPDN